MSDNKPIHQIRLGRVKAAIWENASEPWDARPEGGVRYNVVITRLYKHGHDQWQESGSFGRDDLPLVEKVCHMTHLWIFSRSRGGAARTVSDEGPPGEEEGS